MLSFSQIFQNEIYDAHLSKDVSYSTKRASKISVVHGCLFTDYLTKELYHWEKTYASVIILMMANMVWKILIPQTCIDFHDSENRTAHAQ